MKIGINLASEPFRRDRPVLIGSALVALVMLVSLAGLISLALLDRGNVRRERQVQTRLDRELKSIRTQVTKVAADVRRPENAEVLGRSVLINELLLRKGISWTRIFSDLEKVLPPNVRITTIRPQVTGNNQISLEMTIAADSPEFLTTFLAKLEDSPVFGTYTVATSQAPTQTDPTYRYRMNVSYVQKF